MSDVKNIKAQHRMVARRLAMGENLSDICEALGISFDRWQVIVRAPLFEEEVRKFETKLEQQLLEEVEEDPTWTRLRDARSRAVNRLISEIDNHDFESGASPRTRLAAATNVLDRLGYNKKLEADQSPAVIIQISEGQARVLQSQTAPIQEPASIKG